MFHFNHRLSKIANFLKMFLLNSRLDLLLNDLWRYRVNDSTWTWISGSNTTNQPGNYEKGATNSVNSLGSRVYPAGWYDSTTKEFWLFGGNGLGNTTTTYSGTYKHELYTVEYLMSC